MRQSTNANTSASSGANAAVTSTANAPSSKPDIKPAASLSPAARPFPISNTNMTPGLSQGDQIKAALDTLGIKLIKSEAERDVLKKLVEETRATQQRLERELLENRKELAETRRKMDDQRQETESSKNRQERLEEKLREAQASSLKITRRLEADEQKRARIQRRMERLELVAEEAQNALQSRAMVLLTDSALAGKSGLPSMAASGPVLTAPVLAAPAAGGTISGSLIGTQHIMPLDGETPGASSLWQRPLNLNASVAVLAVVIALGFGWMMSSAANNDQNAVAFLADGSLARIDLKNGTLQPLQLQLKKLDADDVAPAGDTPKVSASGEPLPQSKPDPASTAAAAGETVSVIPPLAAPAMDSSLSGSLKELQDKAYAGIAEAQHDLAAIYTAGNGVKQDYKRASYWFQQAANAGVANAAYNLGVLHHQGLGVTKDITRALDWYRVAALEGHPEAQYNLGIAYIEGIGTKYNPQLAAGFFQKAALSGITEAAYNLGLILENGLLAEPKPSQAMMWYRVGSEGGSVEARNALEQLSNRLGLAPEKAGFLTDGTSLSKLVVKPEREEGPALKANADTLAKILPDLAEMIPNDDQLLTAQIQEQLARRDIYDGPEDGATSSKTIDAIKTYQKQSDIDVTGKANSDTLMTLLKESTAKEIDAKD